MGNDGGSIPTRRELVKEAARNPTTTELKESLLNKQEYYWTTDPTTNKPLSRPLVSDSSGRLYNKLSILEYLLPSNDPDSKVEADKILQGAVKSLKDLVDVKFELDEEASKPKNGDNVEHYICPLTRKPLGPGSKAVYLVPCGHAFTAAAIKQVSGDAGGKCPQCDENYAANDVIPIIPTAETDIARLQLRIKTLKENGLTHSLKKAKKEKKDKSKKRKKNDTKVAGEDNATEDSSVPTLVAAGEKKSSAPTSGRATPQPGALKKSDGIKNAATASLTARVLEEQEARNKRRKLDTNDNLKSLFTSGDTKPSMKNSSDFMTRGFSIPSQSQKR